MDFMVQMSLKMKRLAQRAALGDSQYSYDGEQERHML